MENKTTNRKAIVPIWRKLFNAINDLFTERSKKEFKRLKNFISS